MKYLAQQFLEGISHVDYHVGVNPTTRRVSIQKLFFVVILFVCYCQDLPMSTTMVAEQQRLGFQVRTGDHGDGIRMYIDCGGYPDTLPYVTITGMVPDVFYFSKGVHWYADILRQKQGNYRIIWHGDTLNCDFYVPHKMDSLFCNGTYITDRFYGIDSILYHGPDITSTIGIDADIHDVRKGYDFRWVCEDASHFLLTSIVVCGPVDTFVPSVTTITTAHDTLIIPAVSDSTRYVSIWLRIKPIFNRSFIANNEAPSVSHGSMYSYHIMYGPIRGVIVNVRVLPVASGK